MQSFFVLFLPLRMDHAMEMLTLIYSITFYSVILITRLDLQPDLGCKMHWVCLIYTGTDLFGWHA